MASSDFSGHEFLHFCYFWTVRLGCNNLSKYTKRLLALEMKCQHRLLKINRKKQRINNDVWKKIRSRNVDNATSWYTATESRQFSNTSETSERNNSGLTKSSDHEADHIANGWKNGRKCTCRTNTAQSYAGTCHVESWGRRKEQSAQASSSQQTDRNAYVWSPMKRAS